MLKKLNQIVLLDVKYAGTFLKCMPLADFEGIPRFVKLSTGISLFD